MSQARCRWGILGTANIARKNWQAICNAENAMLVAVASRDRTRALQFIESCQADVPVAPAPEACGSYQQLLERNDVDAVYIPLPTGIRKEWVVRAAEARKHVLCEKPCAVTTQDLRDMLTACEKHNVQFMDGVMFMHSTRLPLLLKTLGDEQSVGSVRRIVSQFSFPGSDEFWAKNIRVNHQLEPLGCLGDLGWYNIRFSLLMMGEQLPERVSGRILNQNDSSSSPPVEFSGELFFSGNVSASFYCSFRTHNQQWANVSGTRGYLHISDFVVPFHGPEAGFAVNNSFLKIFGCDFNVEEHSRRLAVHEYSNGRADSQEANMIRTFSGITISGKLEPRWGEIALKTQRVLDGCLNSARDNGKLVVIQ